MEKALHGLKGEAGTALYDGIYFAARGMQDRDGRKVIVVVTDGGDTVSVKDFHAALREAQRADAVIYSVLVMPITNDAGRNIGGENALTTMGERTGGRVFAPNLGPGIDRAFADILKELRTQYYLAYYPKNVPLTADPFHKLEIKTRDGDLRVSCRNGYYGEVDSSGDRRGKEVHRYIPGSKTAVSKWVARPDWQVRHIIRAHIQGETVTSSV